MGAYENKAFGNFTVRQILCMVIAVVFIAPIFWGMYSLTKSIDVAGYLAALIGIPIVACGFIKRDGVFLERIIVAKWQSKAKFPRKRKFIMRNFYEDIILMEKEGVLNYENLESKKEESGKKAGKKSATMGKKKYSTRKHSV